MIAAEALPLTPSIRPSSPDDLKELCAVIGANDESLVVSFSRDFLDSFCHVNEQQRPRFFTATASGRPVGVTGYRPDAWGAQDVWWLVWLYVDTRVKRRGVATLLFAAAQAELRSIGCRKCYLDVGDLESQADAVAFHERDGFRLEGSLIDFWGAGRHHHIFGKLL